MSQRDIRSGYSPWDPDVQRATILVRLEAILKRLQSIDDAVLQLLKQGERRLTATVEVDFDPSIPLAERRRVIAEHLAHWTRRERELQEAAGPEADRGY